jgi:hypothetical protein
MVKKLSGALKRDQILIVNQAVAGISTENLMVERLSSPFLMNPQPSHQMKNTTYGYQPVVF